MKPAPGTLDVEGIVPACQSLDCVSIFALTVDDAWKVYACLAEGAQRGMPDQASVASNVRNSAHVGRYAKPRADQLEFFGDSDQAELFAASIRRLEQMGGQIVEIDFRPWREVASLLYEGPWVAERLAGIDSFFKTHPADIYPVTRAIIGGGERYSGVDVFKAQARLRTLQAVCERVFADAEFLVLPTMPTIPLLSDVQADSAGWSGRLGYYTSFVNLLGWSALAIPSGFTPQKLPGGITLIGPAGSDQFLCRLGRAWQRQVALPLGATDYWLPPSPAEDSLSREPARGSVRVAVAGAHLRGQPLHPALLRLGARFVRCCRTALRYRFVALMHLMPPRPGLIRDDTRAGSTAVEVFELPYEGFGQLVASVVPPLAIGTIELEDGESVKGFLCESWAAAKALDITDFGDWIAFLNRQDAANRGKDRP